MRLPCINMIEKHSDTNRLSLGWPGVPYVNYRLESSQTLMPGSWGTVSGLETIAAPSTAGDIEVQLPMSANPKNFFRIAVND